MRICAYSVFLLSLLGAHSASYAPQSQVCNPLTDVSFVSDSTNGQAFLKCRAYYPSSSYGHWERHYCPSGMIFEYETQQCLQRQGGSAAVTPAQAGENSVAEEDPQQQWAPRLNIGILNGSCANGEQCIGATVCDLIKLLCLCPYGTVANLETLSCVQPQLPATAATTTNAKPHSLPTPPQQATMIYYGQNSPMPSRYSSSAPQLRIPLQPQQPSPQPIPSSLGGTTSVNQYYRSLMQQLQPLLPLSNNGGYGGGTAVVTPTGSMLGQVQYNSSYSTTNPALPNVFIPIASLATITSTNSPLLSRPAQYTTQAAPGSSCASGEQCGGGSFCVHPANICLCPGDSLSYNGQCALPPIVPPPSQPQQPSTPTRIGGGGVRPQQARVPLGAPCDMSAACDDAGSACVEGRCQCFSPSVEQFGLCVPPTAGASSTPFQQRKLLTVEAGPGELCNQGQVCVKGSFCDPSTPICVCPPGRDLDVKSGWCVTEGQSVRSTLAVNAPQPQGRPVGAKCSLNTDCMSGAYCNGNTQPPVCQCLSTHVNVNDRCMRVVYPGQRGCENDVQCTTGYAGTRCIGGECACPPGSRALDQSCVSVFAWPGDPCNQTYHTQITNNNLPLTQPLSHPLPICAGNSLCVAGRCECPRPLVAHRRQCVAEGAAGELLAARVMQQSCLSNDDCSSSFLCLDGLCDCPPGTSRHSGMCVDSSSAAVGETPIFEDLSKEEAFIRRGGDAVAERRGGEHVPHQASFRQAAGGIEQIFSTIAMLKNTHLRPYDDDDSPPHQRHTVSGEAVMARRARRGSRHDVTTSVRHRGEPCKPGDLCLNGTSCFSGRCACPDGYEFENNTCYPPQSLQASTFRPIGARCVGADRCSGGSVCRNSVCACIDGSVELQGKCRQQPNGRCSWGQLCSGGSSCSLGICQCPNGYRLLPASSGGAVGGTIPTGGGSCVLAVASPGESCQSGERCANGSACRLGLCMCPADHHVVRGKCEPISASAIPTLPLGKKKKAPTLDSSASSANHVLVDVPVTSPSRGRVVGPGNSCSGGESCSGGAVCRERYCQCADDEVIIQEKCVGNNGEALQAIERIGKSAPGQLCSGESQCTGGSVCRSGICICPDGSTLFRGECLEAKPTLSTINAHKGHALLFSPEAAVMDSPGEELNAVKAPRFQAYPPMKVLVPGAMCSLSLECPYRTECIRGVCRCRQRLETIVNGVCRKAIHEVLPGGRCDTQRGLDCIGESHCFYGICVCLYGLVNVGHECASAHVLQKARPGESCDLGQQCEGGAECRDGACQCRKEEVLEVGKRCVTKNAVIPFYTNSGDAAAGTLALEQEAHAELLGPALSGQSRPGSQHKLATSAAGGGKQLIYGLPGLTDDGKFNQILTANQMSINVLDQETLRNLLTTQHFLRVPGVGEKCDGVCGRNARCVQSTIRDRTCLCTEGTVESGGSCVAKTPAEFNSLMQSGRGSPGNMCLPEAHPDQPQQSECYGGSLCIGGLCVCRPGYRPHDGYCQIAKVQLGEPCFFNEQCRGTYGNGFCVDGICTCKSAYNGMGLVGFDTAAGRPHRSHRCPTRPIAQAGEDCTKWQAACGWNSVCSRLSGVCECPSGMERHQGACVVARRPRGATCHTSTSCQKNAHCDNGYCICKAGYVAVQQFCLPPPQLVIDDPRAYLNPDTSGTTDNTVNKAASYEQGPHAAAYVNGAREYAIDSAVLSQMLPPPVAPPTRTPFGGKFGRLGNNNPFGGPISMPPSADQQQHQWNTQGDLYSSASNEVESLNFQRLTNGLRGWGGDDGRPQAPTPLPWDMIAPYLQQQLAALAAAKLAGWDGSQWHFPTSSPRPFQLPLPATTPPTSLSRGSKTLTLGDRGEEAKEDGDPNASETNDHDEGETVEENDNGDGEDESGGEDRQHAQQHGSKTKSDKSSQLEGQGSKRVALAMPGEHCSAHRICLGNSRCISGWCQCPDGMHIEKGICAFSKKSSQLEHQQQHTNLPFHRPPVMSGSVSIPPFVNSIMYRPPQAASLPTHESSGYSHYGRYRLPYESCANYERCVEGADCLKSNMATVNRLGPFCMCRPDRLHLTGACILRHASLEVVPIGGHCGENRVCDSGAECAPDTAICRCPSGKRQVVGLCVRQSLPGESCANGEFCTDGAVCVTGIDACVCPVGMEARAGRCQKEGTGGNRRIHHPLPSSSARSDHHQRTHDKTPGLDSLKPVWSPFATNAMSSASGTGGSQLAMREQLPGQPCIDEDVELACSSNSYCSPSTGLCVCNEGHVEVYGRCVDTELVRLPGEVCTLGEICSLESWCKDGVCQCLSKRPPLNGRCDADGADRRGPQRQSTRHSSSFELQQSIPPSFLALQNLAEERSGNSPTRRYSPASHHHRHRNLFTPSSLLHHHPPPSTTKGRSESSDTLEEHIRRIFRTNRLVRCIGLVAGGHISGVNLAEYQSASRPRVPNEGCPVVGGTCRSGYCYCNGVAVRQRHRLGADWRIDSCDDRDEKACPPPLQCLQGRCVCIRAGEEEKEEEEEDGSSPHRAGVTVLPPTTPPTYSSDERAEVGNDGSEEDDDEGDYAEEISEVTSRGTTNHTIPFASAVILPGMFCDAYSRCGWGAQCKAGVCQCSNPQERLTFINGSTMCVNAADDGIGESGQRADDRHDWDHSADSKQPRGLLKIRPLETPHDGSERDSRPAARRRRPQHFTRPAEVSKMVNANEGWDEEAAQEHSIASTLPVGEGGACSFSYQCARNLTCFASTCTCMEATGCIPMATLERVADRRDKRRGRALLLMFSEDGRSRVEVPAGASCSNGEVCGGGSLCRDGWCVCPDASMTITGNGVCVPKSGIGKLSSRVPPEAVPDVREDNSTLSPTPHQQLHPTYHLYTASPILAGADHHNIAAVPASNETQTFVGAQRMSAAPGSHCGPLDVCLGGSTCVEGICLCPAGTRPSAKTGNCEMFNAHASSETPAASPSRGKAMAADPQDDSGQPQPIMIDECTKLGIVCARGTTCLDARCLEICPEGTQNSGAEGRSLCIPGATLNTTADPSNAVTNLDMNGTAASMVAFDLAAASSRSSESLFAFDRQDGQVAERKYARPSESCANGEICTGGALCQDRKICSCTPLKPIVREHICIASDEKPMLRARRVPPGGKCDSESRCTNNSMYASQCNSSAVEYNAGADIFSCHDGVCKCQTDSLLTPEGICAETTTRASHTTTMRASTTAPSTTTTGAAATLSQQLANSSMGWDETTSPTVAHMQRDEGGNVQRKRIPKVVGPPLLPLIALPTTEGNDKQPTVDETGKMRGVCPPHNPPLMDASGKLLLCNGMEPNCPPKSYCFVTGVASELYNCCQVH